MYKLSQYLTNKLKRPVDMVWELDFVRKLRNFSDGIDFFNLEVQVDLYRGDHTSRFHFMLVIFNLKVIEFNFYNSFHDYDEDDEDL